MLVLIYCITGKRITNTLFFYHAISFLQFQHNIFIMYYFYGVLHCNPMESYIGIPWSLTSESHGVLHRNPMESYIGILWSLTSESYGVLHRNPMESYIGILWYCGI
jgi:hypothetical protein